FKADAIDRQGLPKYLGQLRYRYHVSITSFISALSGKRGRLVSRLPCIVKKTNRSRTSDFDRAHVLCAGKAKVATQLRCPHVHPKASTQIVLHKNSHRGDTPDAENAFSPQMDADEHRYKINSNAPSSICTAIFKLLVFLTSSPVARKTSAFPPNTAI